MEYLDVIFSNYYDKTKVETVLFCFWKNGNNFNPNLLENLMPNVSTLIIEHGNLRSLLKEFPDMINLEVNFINIFPKITINREHGLKFRP